MMKKVFLLSVLLLGACGTVFSGTTQDISIDSNVDNVSVYVNGAFVCKTPCIYPLDRESGSVSIVGKKEGYEDMGIALKSKMNPVAWGNLIFVYSWTTDIIDGAAWKYKQNGVYLNMEKKNMKRAELIQFKKDSEIRRFALFNFDELQLEASKKESGEYITALAQLTGMQERTLIKKIEKSAKEPDLAKSLVN